jgi:hypothetical protein
MTTPEEYFTRKVDVGPEGVCPFLGLHDDSDTRFMYATTGNYCHRVEPPEPIAPAYQGVVCLKGSEFPSCPVYKQTWKGSLPEEIIGDLPNDRRGARRFWLLFALVVFLGAVLAIFLFGKSMILDTLAGLRSDPIAMQSEGTVVYTATDTPAGLFPATDALVVEAPSQVPTNTPEPSPSDTSGVPTPGPGLMTPFGPDAFLLLHRVLENESLPMIAEHYNTNSDVMRAANGFGEKVNLRPGDVLVVPFGKKTTTGVDVYRALLVETDTTLADLAFRYTTTEDTLRSWNSLGPGELIPAGRWLVVPLIAEERQYPTATPTPFDWSEYALKGPFGPNDEFVLHQVQEGENLTAIMQLYNTTKDVTWMLNNFEDAVIIQPGQVMLLMPGKRNLEDVQRFQLVSLADDKGLEELAEMYGVSASILAEYNDLVSDLVPAHSWIVIP